MAGATGESGAGGCPPCKPCPPQRTTLVVTKKQRYPHGRHCKALNTGGSCRCSSWGAGRGKTVTEMCREAGREFRIGSRVLKTKG